MLLTGSMVHTDSLGVHDRTEAGGVQVMRAGSGMEHSERNASEDEPFVGIQVWVAPRTENTEPSVARHQFERGPEWTLMVAANNAPLIVDQDLRFSQVQLPTTGSATWTVDAGRAAYVAVPDGAVDVNGQRVERLERAVVRGPLEVTFTSKSGAHVVLMDLPLDEHHEARSAHGHSH